MSEYAILIYQNDVAREKADPDTMGKLGDGHRRFMEKHAAALRGGKALHLPGTATSLRHDGTGEMNVTDGPFVETKEALGGFYLIEAADLDEALAIAADVPALDGGVEVRPVRVTA